MINQLYKSSSPYLIQHKDNPVHWQLWSHETLQLSKHQNKPILVSVGYSTCHWCHVMAHECFEDKEIAALMNSYFINIKIDREERPDLDHFFMNAVQCMGVSGGWPLHCFLTPDLKPFYGGTYFPPVPKYGRISWPELLKAIHKAYQERNLEIISQSNKLYDVIMQASTPIANVDYDNHSIPFDQIAEFIQQLSDFENGGFGFGQKFPNSMLLQYLIKSHHHNIKFDFRAFIKKSIQSLCFGGMFDHIQGGFFRYTVDKEWKIPHFEKMAYDHALILGLLADYLMIHSNVWCSYFIDKSVEFWETEMKADNGLFYAALDADSNGKEGLYYLWTESEIQNVIQDTTSDFLNVASLSAFDNQQGKVLNLLNLLEFSEADSLSFLSKNTAIFAKLKKARSERIKPSTDTKFILAWNALLVSMYSKLFHATDEERYKFKAVELIDLIQKNFTIDWHCSYFCRTTNLNGDKNGFAFLEDYAYYLDALLRTYEISGTELFLNRTLDLLNILNTLFAERDGIYLITNKLHVDSLAGSIDLKDSSLPNPNAIIASVYFRLYLMLSDKDYYNKFSRMQTSAMSTVHNDYFSHASWLLLSPEITDRYILVKSNNSNIPKGIKSLFKNREVVYFYSDEIQEGAVVICTGQKCSKPFYSIDEVATYLEQDN